MRGQISEQPFAELLREIHQSSLSGAVRIEHTPVRAVIYLEDGDIVFAASNTRELRFADYISKRGLVALDQLSNLTSNRSDTGLATQLNTQGLLETSQIQEVFQALVNDISRVALLWSDGSWEFDDRTRFADSFRAKLHIPTLLLESARKIGLKFVAHRFPNPAEIISPGIAVQDSDRLLPAEAFLLSRVGEPLRLGELLLLSGVRELDAMRMVYGLSLAGFLERELWPAILKNRLLPAPPPDQLAKVPEPIPQINLEEQELQNFLARAEGAETLYQTLDVAPTADAEEIKLAYYGLARSYHPDRFHGKDEVHARLESAFARITQAYEVLTDDDQRSNYDARIIARERARQIADAAPKAAVKDRDDDAMENDSASLEKSFRDGYAALQLGQTSVAITNLAAAAQGAPSEPRYRAYYGQALARTAKTQRLAETELQAAIKLDPDNATYHMMLAQLYYELTFFRRARSAAERALELDPNNSAARQFLRRLKEK